MSTPKNNSAISKVWPARDPDKPRPVAVSIFLSLWKTLDGFRPASDNHPRSSPRWNKMANHDECHKDYIECILSREQQNLQAAALHVLRTLDEVCNVYSEPLWLLERQVFRGLWRNMEECIRFMLLHLKPPPEDRDWERNPEEEEVAEGETRDRSKK
ncbi:hypothetical protein JTE90_014813 [Oedothorax gibbosus]|uniref:Uncharacterized protein n=1 Tax=Oedothorax gibbosus TaxID=931172 RepID=A0AAV6TF21_9ARAC|nr:hypothetical protein JTE90_014813 [Oedothorax gibbosus]